MTNREKAFFVHGMMYADKTGGDIKQTKLIKSRFSLDDETLLATLPEAMTAVSESGNKFQQDFIQETKQAVSKWGRE